jgi:methylenetetrahydrofolate--tRNA-(uracil-5-)-methyltransferase
LLTALLTAGDTSGTPQPPPPPETALGALLRHVTGEGRLEGRPHEPQNVNWGMFPPLPQVKKRERKAARVERARAALEAWAEATSTRLLNVERAI